MPVERTPDRLEKIKRRQAKRGVIESLRGRNWPRENIFQKSRSSHTNAVMWARERLSSGLGPYGYFGNHYQGVPSPEVERSLVHVVGEALEKAKKGKEKIRWLDIGPGDPTNFMPFFKEVDPRNKLIDLHTISPEQIRHPNRSEYEDLEKRFTHHVGTIETYDPRKLGQFHLIVSIVGGTFYTGHHLEVLEKVARLLHKGGKAVLEIPPLTRRPVNTYNLVDLLSTKLGPTFKVESGKNHLVITRKS